MAVVATPVIVPALTLPPTYKLPPIPTPPVTTNAPVVVLVADVEPVIVAEVTDNICVVELNVKLLLNPVNPTPV